MRSVFCVLALLLAVMVAMPARAVACLPDQTPSEDLTSAIPVAGAFCVSGTPGTLGRHLFTWTIGPEEADRLWTIRTEALPGEAAVLTLSTIQPAEAGAAASATELARADVLSPRGDLELPNLLLQPGTYLVSVQTLNGLGLYRLFAGSSDEDMPAADTEPAPHRDTFRSALVTTETELRLPWQLSAAGASRKWTLTLIAPPGLSAALYLNSPDGRQLALAYPLRGTARLSDLGLASGEYELNASGFPPGTKLLLEAEPAGPRTADSELEPNDDIATASALGPALSSSGRLVGARSDQDQDYFALEVPEDWRTESFDVVASSPADTRLSLFDSAGNMLQERRGSGEVSLPDLVLQPGHYLLAVTGQLPLDQSYSLAIRRNGPGQAAYEREPNDAPAGADPLGTTRAVKGALKSDEADTFSFVVEGPPQLWRVTATGGGLTRVLVIDPSGVGSTEAWRTSDSDRASLSNLLLLPGRHFVQVQGVGEYSLAVDPLGGFDPVRDEVEPNDAAAVAQPLVFGVARTGRIDNERDRDTYRFALAGNTHLALHVTGVPAQVTHAVVRRAEDGSAVAEVVVPSDVGRPVVWDAALPLGDYTVDVYSDTPSADPYGLLLERRPWFGTSTDREPNNAIEAASSAPPDLRLTGDLYGGDIDWYELPGAAAGQHLVLRSQSPALANQTLYVNSADGQGPWLPLAVSGTAYLSPTSPGVWEADIPAGDKIFLAVGNGFGAYAIDLEIGTSAGHARPALHLSLDLPVKTIAANSPSAQHVEGKLVVANHGAEGLSLDLSPVIGREDWALALGETSITLAAGQQRTMPIELEIAPDTEPGVPVSVAVSATADGFDFGAEASLLPDARAAPLSPHDAPPLPAELLGGLNVAWSAFGGTISEGAERLIDGLATGGSILTSSVSPDGEPRPVIDLAGDEPVEVAGVVLDSTTFGPPTHRLKDFAVSVSLDGTTFQKVLEASLSIRPGEQGFAFASPVSARFVRLDPLSNHGADTYAGYELAELKVVATNPPPAKLLGNVGRIVLSRPDLGGHVVWMSPGSYAPLAILTSEVEHPLADVSQSPDDPVEWVVAFRDSRAARIGRIEWQDPELDPSMLPESVKVSVSTVSANGPWEALGEWSLDRTQGGGPAPFVPAASVWARYVRFTISPPFASRAVALPEMLSITEGPVDRQYPSSVGEWGSGRSQGPFEQLNSPRDLAAIVASTDVGGSDRLTAATLLADVQVANTVELAVDEDWFKLQVPDGLSRLTLYLGTLQDDVEVNLVDGEGASIDAIASASSGGERTVTADLPAGTYFARVHEPERSIVIAWDTSGSVLGSLPEIVQSVVGLVGSLQPGREKINLIPFRGQPSMPLLDDWAREPVSALAALQNYSWTDSSSNAEAALLGAAKLFAETPGAHAIVVITDAESDGAFLNDQLWRLLGKTPPRIFVLAVPTGTDGLPAEGARELMQDWANVNGGWVQPLISRSAVGQAFDRLAAQLRRPKEYTLRAALSAPPPPGRLRVDPPGPVGGQAAVAPVGDQAVEIILDASGSMLQRVQGTRKIEIAKSILSELVLDTLPPSLPFALRVFGQGAADSCDTDLVMPLSGLDAPRAVETIKPIRPTNGAKTPIAASLRSVAEDLAGAPGRRLVVLLTDGEETCDGDVSAEIANLRSAGVDVRINVVGFSVDDPTVEQEFALWAEEGGGVFFSATDLASLRDAMKSALLPEYQVIDARGTVISRATVGGTEISLPPGQYIVRILSLPPQTHEVAIAPATLTELRMP